MHSQTTQEHALTLRETIIANKEDNVKRREDQLKEDIKRLEIHLLAMREKIHINEANAAEKTLPIGWTEHFSPEHGVAYSHNRKLTRSMWTFPQTYVF